MPVDPHTWQPEDYVSASRLDNDFYSVLGQAFSPNGVRFHARRPLYKATQANSGLVVNAGAWRGMFQGAGASVLVDNSGYYGVLMDPDYAGSISDAIVYSNGNPNAPQGSSGSPVGGGGGWYLVSAFAPVGQPSGAFSRISLTNGWQGSNPNLLSTGTAQTGNASHDIAPYVVDLIYFDGGTYTPVVQNQGSSSAPLRTTVDGSGETCYFNAQWMSVNTAYGFTASAAPAPLTSWTSQAVTSALLNGNTGIRDILRFLNMPPALRTAATTSVNCPNSTQTVINLGAAQLDSYGGWSNGTDTYTVPFDGLYLTYGVVAWQATANNVPGRAGIVVNGGSPIWGPWNNTPAGNSTASAKLHILDLHAGDTVQLVGLQNSSATVGTSTSTPSTLLLAWVGSRNAPSPFPTVPDLSYTYPAGMSPTALQAALNGHLANDLNFLVNRPFLLGRQNTAQSIAQSTSTAVTMDTITGQVHGTAGDPWSGWDATNHRYVAPVSGWYLAVQETFFGTPTLTVTPSTLALFQIKANSGASSSWDWYQHMNLPTANAPGGAAAMGYYYLRAGDWITPGVQTQDTASGTFSTFVSGPKSHFECIWVSE